jgi:hypothetical protein
MILLDVPCQKNKFTCLRDDCHTSQQSLLVISHRSQFSVAVVIMTLVLEEIKKENWFIVLMNHTDLFQFRNLLISIEILKLFLR